jgi:hypothetical protein
MKNRSKNNQELDITNTRFAVFYENVENCWLRVGEVKILSLLLSNTYKKSPEVRDFSFFSNLMVLKPCFFRSAPASKPKRPE